jgi:hypothetical protein
VISVAARRQRSAGTGEIAGTTLDVELDGQEIHPQSVDGGLLIRLAAAVISTLDRLLDAQGYGPTAFTGLQVKDKCASLACGVPRPRPELDAAVGDLGDVVGGFKPAPKGAGESVDGLRSVLREVPDGQRASIRYEQHVIHLKVPAITAPAASASMGFRCTVLSVGGKKPGLRVSCSFQERVALSLANYEQAQELSRHLYEELDVRVMARFDENFRIKRAKLLSWVPVDQTRDAMAELAKWAAENFGDIDENDEPRDAS